MARLARSVTWSWEEEDENCMSGYRSCFSLSCPFSSYLVVFGEGREWLSLSRMMGIGWKRKAGWKRKGKEFENTR